MNKEIADASNEATKTAIDNGLLIQFGWVGFVDAAYAGGLPQGHQREQLKSAFYAGAYHLFSSLCSAVEGGDEITQADQRMMDCIASELDAFLQEFKTKHGISDDLIAPTGGVRN